MKNAIIITPSEEIKTVEYKGTDTIHEIVDGFFDVVKSEVLHVQGYGDIEWIAFCNDEGLLQDTAEDNKVNALITGFYGYPIYGNVCMLKEFNNSYGERDSTGFDDIEALIITGWLEEVKEQNKDAIAGMHQELDQNKPKAEPQIISLEDYLENMDR